jgi:4-hydroxy-tetrahydrodipicolinate synthase
MHVSWHGVFPAVTTHFHDDESLDLPSLGLHIDRLIAASVQGIIALGTVGENGSLEAEEKRVVLRYVVEKVNKRVPVLIGVAENTTAAACRFAEAAEKYGADGLMLLPAMIYKADSRETIAHFRTVARATSLPIMCYNNPVSYHVDITPAMFVDLADEPRFVAIKESSENVRRIIDDLILESVLLGAVGWVSGLVNAFPDENRLLWNYAINRQYDDALRIYRWYTPLLHLDTHVKLVQYIKLAMAEVGLGSEKTRPPRLPLIGKERENILAVIRYAIATRPQF